MKTRESFGDDFRCMVAIWNSFRMRDFTYPIRELNILIAILALEGNPHVHPVAAMQLKFLKK